MFFRGRGIGASSRTLTSGTATPGSSRSRRLSSSSASRSNATGPASIRSSIAPGIGTPAMWPRAATSITRSPSITPSRAASSTVLR